MANGNPLRLTTGSVDFSSGVDSSKVPTIASPQNPNGLKFNQLAWGNNITVRDAGISPRAGWRYLATMPFLGLYQSGYMYEPDFEFPYLVLSIGGRIFRVRVDLDPVTIDEIGIPGDPNPANVDLGYMVQGEQFLVIQVGDFITNPLFWDGQTMRRSLGNAVLVGITSANFVVPAVGGYVLVTLGGPYQGSFPQIVLIGTKQYLAIKSTNIERLRNIADPNVGSTYPAGTQLLDGGGNVVGTTLAPFVVPAAAATVDVIVDMTHPGPYPVPITIEGYSWTIAATGFPPAGANQVYLVNLTDTPTTVINAPAAITSFPELPPGGPMDYYMGRIWVAAGREYVAGDIVLGPSGSAQYDYRDSILKMTENAYTAGGGSFIVPTNAGNIRALAHPANLDTNLGEGQLMVFTRRTIYSVNVTPTRADWILLKEPLQRVVQRNFGTTSDRSVVPVNGDLFYQSVDGVRSFIQAIRYFEQWGNTPISEEEQRAILINDRLFLRFGTGIEFNNRLLESCLPYQTPYGVAHRALMALNFDLQGSIAGKLPPVWEGVSEGLPFLQLFKGDFGGRQRAFGLIYSELHNALEIWELTTDDPEDEGTEGSNRVIWSFETPSFTWNDPFQLKELETAEFWVDRLSGLVEFKVEYKNDQGCWIFWHYWKECSQRNECEALIPPEPCDYPTQQFCAQYRATMVLPKPPVQCDASSARPSNIGYAFALRVSIKGKCRIRGIMLHALERGKTAFEGLRCNV